jgi:hypothetical protein
MSHFPTITAATAGQFSPHFDTSTWDIGRSGDLGSGVEVWTSWLPVQGYFETLVVDRDGSLRTFVNDAISYNINDAMARHTMTVRHVRAALAAQEEA